MEENNLNQYIQENGELKDEFVTKSLGFKYDYELEMEAPKIFDQLIEDKISIEKNIIYSLANLEIAMNTYQKIQNNKLEAEIVNNESSEVKEKEEEFEIEELVLNTVKEFKEQLESCQDDLTIVNKAISIITRYDEF